MIDDDIIDAPPQITVKIADIALRPAWQVRERLNEQLVWAYVTNYASGAALPPVRLANLGGAYVLVDGWHRLAALKKLERDTTDAIIVATTEEDGRWEAAKANTTNGLRLRRSECRNVFRVYIDTKRHLKGRAIRSYREIQRDLGGIAGKSILQKWMHADFPKIAARMASGRLDNKGGDPLQARPTALDLATGRVRDAIQQALAEARAITCPAGRLMAAVELENAARAITQIKTTEDEAFENPDF
jgi:hypothetical protein